MLRTLISTLVVAAVLSGGIWAWFSLQTQGEEQKTLESYFSSDKGVLVSSSLSRGEQALQHLEELGVQVHGDLATIVENVSALELDPTTAIHIQTDGNGYVIAIMDDSKDLMNVLSDGEWKTESRPGYSICHKDWDSGKAMEGPISVPASGLAVHVDGQYYEVLHDGESDKFFTSYQPSEAINSFRNRTPSLLEWRLEASSPYLFIGIRDPFGAAKDLGAEAQDLTQVAWVGEQVMYMGVGSDELLVIEANATMDAGRLLEEFSQGPALRSVGDVNIFRLNPGHALEVFMPGADSGLYYANYQGMILTSNQMKPLTEAIASYNSGVRVGASLAFQEPRMLEWGGLDSLNLSSLVKSWIPELPEQLFGRGGKVIRNGDRWFLSGYLKRQTATKDAVVINAAMSRKWTLPWSSSASKAIKTYRVQDHLSGGRGFFIVQLDSATYVDRNGQVKWRVALGAPVVGEPQMVDLFQNRKKQILITTSKKIHLLDLKGREVDGFPISSRQVFTAAARLIRYPDQKAPRIIAGMANRTWSCYDGNGKAVQGWTSQQAQAAITTPVTWVSYASKDYLLSVDARGQVYALNRRGQNRVQNLPKLDPVREMHFEKGTDILSCRYVYWKDDMVYHTYLSGQRDSFQLEKPSHTFRQPDELMTWASGENKLVQQDGLGLIQMEWDLPVPYAVSPRLLSSKTQKVLFLTPSKDELYLLDNLGLTVPGFPLQCQGFFELWEGKDATELLMVSSGELGLYELKP